MAKRGVTRYVWEMSKSDFNSREFISGFKDILPLALGVGVYGLAFGLLAAQAMMSGLQVGVMGTVVFAGASQIVAIERLVTGGGAVAAVLAGVGLNLRLLLVTVSVRDVFVGRPWWQVALGAHLATDESWSLTLATRARGLAAGYWYLVGGGLNIMLVWLVATLSGVLFAHAIPEPRALGMDFAFTAAFIAIACSLWKGSGDLLPWAVSFLVVAGLAGPGLVDPSWALIAGGLSGAVVAGVRGDD